MKEAKNMGMLSKKTAHFEHIQNAVSPVLRHFDRVGLKKNLINDLASAADLAFSDELLLEKFEIWNEQKDDDIFLFHIEQYFAKRHLRPSKEQDQTDHRETIEASIKEQAREEQKRTFAQRLTQLAVERGLDTNEKLGDFLGVSTEQARKFRSGDSKPQLATLRNVSKKFSVSVEYLTGFSSAKRRS
jgi:hypothetical protein